METKQEKIRVHKEAIERYEFDIDMYKDFIWFHENQIKELEDGLA